MKFILVKCAGLPLRQFRATTIKPDGNPIDFFFWAADQEAAKEMVRAKWPEAAFSDEMSTAS